MTKIYLSATYQDLKAHRDAVYRILRMLRHDVISMEDYVASNAYPLHQCLADVAASALYVGLIGWRYGYRPGQDNPEDRSITELEYRQAGASNRPQLMFLSDPGVPWPDAFKDAETGEGAGGQRIEAFRAELETACLVSHFRSPDHLAGLVSVAVQRCLQDMPIAKPPTRSKIQEVKVSVLNQRLDALLEDYEAAAKQLSYIIDAVDQNRLKRRMTSIEDDIEQVEREIDAIGS